MLLLLVDCGLGRLVPYRSLALLRTVRLVFVRTPPNWAEVLTGDSSRQ
jgi:hypothetical protein